MTPSSSTVSQGFLLTRRQLDSASGVQLEYWLSTAGGPVRLVTSAQKPVFFIEQQDADGVQTLIRSAGLSCEIKPLALRTFAQVPVSGVYFSRISHGYRAREVLHDAGIISYEDDIRLTERFLMERFTYGSLEFSGHRYRRDGYLEITSARVKPSDYRPELTVLSLDIECSEAGELYSIGLVSRHYQVVLMIGEAQPGPEWIQWVVDEKSLLESLVECITDRDPDLIVGWNIVNFDFRMLIQRAHLFGVKLRLGRGRELARWRDGAQDTNQGFISIPGRLVIDGIDGLKTATYQFDSFSLEYVAQSLLGHGKATEDVDDRMAAITHDFHHDKIKLAEYNRVDCELVLDIFDHTRLLDFLVLRSQLTGLELDRAGGSVAAFINLYLPKLHRAGYVSPNRPSDGGLASPGGYVMNSRPGLYQQVLVLDFKSLYPSIIRTFKIDPLGLVEGLREPETAIPGFKGASFDREQHFLPDIITRLWAQRDEAKREQDAARSQAIKILMNSFYGVLGSGGCPFYDTRLASSITLRGHEIMQTTAGWIEQAGYRVIYGDTDSTFVWLEGVEDSAEAEQIGQALERDINQRWQTLIAEQYQLESYLEIEFETRFDQFLMPTIRGSEQGSKKRYAGLKHTDKGPQLVFKGLESVRSDWTALAKQFQQTLYAKVFTGEPVGDYIRRTVAQTRAGDFDDQLVYRKRLRQALDRYVKNVPPHVKAARIADAHRQSEGKTPKYQHKGWINYLITTAGPEPLEYLQHPIDYEHYIEKQLMPIADGILPFIGTSFEQLASDQLGLF